MTVTERNELLGRMRELALRMDVIQEMLDGSTDQIIVPEQDYCDVKVGRRIFRVYYGSEQLDESSWSHWAYFWEVRDRPHAWPREIEGHTRTWPRQVDAAVEAVQLIFAHLTADLPERETIAI